MSEAINSEQENLVLSPPSGFKLICTVKGHSDIITQIAWSSDGKKLASASKDYTIRLWSAETGELISVLEGHTDTVVGIAWSPDGGTIASVAEDDTIKLWNTNTGKLRSQIQDESCNSIAWSPDGKTFAAKSKYYSDSEVKFWNARTGEQHKIPQKTEGKNPYIITGELLRNTITMSDVVISRGTLRIDGSYVGSSFGKLQSFTEISELKRISNFAWSPNGKTLALTQSRDCIKLYDSNTMQLSSTLEVKDTKVLNLAWSPNSKILVAAILDGTIRLWETETGLQFRILEGHADAVTSVSFSGDGQFLVSKSLDDSVRIWRCDTWETIAIFHESTSRKWLSSLAFNPKLPILATTAEKDVIIHIWELDFSTLLTAPPVTSSVHYVNAKVVIVGDTGVGKSGLGLVLSGEYFRATESTHGRRVWTFDKYGVVESNRPETHETLLWDLAGQPGYRLIHQLHLNEIAVALVVFDTRSETDPFAGVRHWDRALTQAQRLQSSSTPLKKFLVAARADRGGIGVSQKRIDTWVKELSFDGYFETSAKEGWQIPELANAIRNAINWTTLPSVSSTKLFQQIKDFLIAEKKAERLLSTVDDLYRAFLKSEDAPSETENWRSQFEICIGRVESRDLIRRLSFGNYVLLQPELLDAYASALINAAKDEPDGLGNIAEEDARYGRFRMSEDERIKDKALEELLLIATVEELLCHELALREWADDGAYLVFPSQFTREWPDAPNPEGQTVIFEFEGAVLNIYATLAVRLTRSGLFIKQDLWKNAATYKAKVGGLCGMFLREVQEGKGELTLFFDKAANQQTRYQFEDYILIHLNRRSLAESIKQRRILTCHNCDAMIPEQHIQMRRERGLDWIMCSVCETRISLVKEPQTEQTKETRVSILTEMDKTADLQRNRDTATSSLQGKIFTKDFDVFLCHNSDDKPMVKLIGEQLKELGILPWLDEWELRPGLPWQRALEEQIKNIKAAAVFIGKNNTGPWQDAELDAFLRQFVKRRCPVIPVLLPDCDQKPDLPIFLEGMMWVDFRKSEPDPMKQLIWGITDERSI
ncbi:MAG: TIR domain-containing protein [Nostoc sp. TH1S01]|nr:TIR domain-containing protein [Nostoc sp. TH1S01]